MKKLFMLRASALILVFGILALCPGSKTRAYDVNNEFIPGAFPEEVSSRIFSIPFVPGELMVVYPGSVESKVEEMQALLLEKCGVRLQFSSAEKLDEKDIVGKHLIVLGNIMNNKWALELYKRRYAFADAYFPGKGGVIIHPAKSLWNPEKNVIVIGVSCDDDLFMGFKAFVEQLGDGAKTIGIIHRLETSLKFPKPPESVAPAFDHVRQNLHTTMAPYWSIANWGLLYFLSGDIKWAEHFRDGFYLCYERAEKTGQWIPESWTNIYFNLWKMVMVWELLDDDPFFTMEDRRIFDEVLWGYTHFVRWLPNLDERFAPPGEARQNHTTFLALSLYYAHRYYTVKYGITGLAPMAEKYRRAFDSGQAFSFRPNDDAGGYLYLAPLHHLTYSMAEGDDSFLASGRLRTLIDLITATIDNRRDPVSFGDVGGYSHRKEGSPRGRELKFYGMAAWYYGDGVYQWLYNRGSRGRVISLDTMKSSGRKEENPIQMHFGSDRIFTVEDMYSGVYAVDIKEEAPARYLGVFPVMLDESSLRWSARRSAKNSQIPLDDVKYFDKISFRTGFNPEDEYLLLDGTSTFSHGHHDGNTITRLTWKDRIWLFDLDYIKLTPRYHNGVVVVRDGIQEAPPPLNVLDYSADFTSFGFTRTISRDYNGADWERNIIWNKGRYFLFLDRVKARKNGEYRLECRWRTRGDVNLTGNELTVHQGDKSFYIKSADSASRSVVIEPDGHRSRWNYPYGNGLMSVCLARKKLAMSKNSGWTFANLMYAADNSTARERELLEISDGVYMVSDSENIELVGLSPDVLENEGIYTDCGLFLHDSRHIRLLDVSFLKFRDVSMEAPGKVHLEINYYKNTGKLVVPEESAGIFKIQNLILKKACSTGGKAGGVVKLATGTYEFTFRGDLWNSSVPFLKLARAARYILPESRQNKAEDFGIETLRLYESDDSITAACQDGDALICAYSQGRITRYNGSNHSEICGVPSERPVACVFSADIDGDGRREIIVGDDKANIYCYDSSGKKLWSFKMTKFYGTDANAVDITVGDIDGSGTQTVLVATGGWKLYAFEPDGAVRWESFIYYHPLTKVKILNNDNGKTYIAVGTEYHTPLNVVSPADGKVIWHVWEEMGSEFLSVTDYCGIHLTDMLFMDTDLDGGKDIVFGTKYNRVYALNTADGITMWETNVGDEVTVMKEIEYHPTGEKRIAVATDAGDLVLLDRAGKRLKTVSFDSEITGMEILSYPEQGRNDIIISTVEGRVIVCDDDFLVRASAAPENAPVKALIMGGKSGDTYLIYCVSEHSIHLLKYRPYFLKKSRFY